MACCSHWLWTRRVCIKGQTREGGCEYTSLCALWISRQHAKGICYQVQLSHHSLHFVALLHRQPLIRLKYPVDTGSQAIINHNPIQDVSHEEFFQLIGPLLYLGHPAEDSSGFTALPPSPPLDWVHFEGRDVATTSQNLASLDSWLKEKDWRNHVALSMDLGKPGRTGLESVSKDNFFCDQLFMCFYSKLIPHADVIFFLCIQTLCHKIIADSFVFCSANHMLWCEFSHTFDEYDTLTGISHHRQETSHHHEPSYSQCKVKSPHICSLCVIGDKKEAPS